MTDKKWEKYIYIILVQKIKNNQPTTNLVIFWSTQTRIPTNKTSWQHDRIDHRWSNNSGISGNRNNNPVRNAYTGVRVWLEKLRWFPTKKCTFQVWSRKTPCMLDFRFWVFLGSFGEFPVHHKNLFGASGK